MAVQMQTVSARLPSEDLQWLSAGTEATVQSENIDPFRRCCGRQRALYVQLQEGRAAATAPGALHRRHEGAGIRPHRIG
jgi:hypothetical protein